MKVSCNRKQFLAGLSAVSGVVPSRSPKPILQNIKLATDADGIATLFASDLEIGITHRPLGVTIYEPGAAILPTSKIQEIFAKSNDADISIEADGDSILIRGKTSKYQMPAEDPALYPEVPGFAARSWWTAAGADYRLMIRRCIPATDNESVRYALGGVLHEWADDRLVLVATDGRRLVRAESPCEANEGAAWPGGSLVVPVKALKLVDRNLDDDELSVDLAWAVAGRGAAASAFLLRTGDGRTTIYSRLVEGRFPRWADVFPTEPATRIDLDVVATRQAVEQAAIVTSDESRGVRFCWGGRKLVMESQAADVGSGRVEIEIEYDGPELEATMDPRYVVDCLKTIPDDVGFEVNVIDHKNAIRFKASDGMDSVIMPLTTER